MAEKIADIKNAINACDIKHLEELLISYKDDDRSGVVKLIRAGYKKIEKYNLELQRIELMKQFEKKYSDYKFICGIDEVGRGPLAGPVMAGAVILPKDCDILYLNDSKQ